MKSMNVCILALTLLLTAASPAQITLTSNRNPVPGDHIISALVDTTGVHEGQAGANRTWDFSGILFSGDSTSIAYVAPAQTPAAAAFPGASVATEYVENGDSAYSYYFTAGTHMAFLGVSTLDLTIVYSNAEVMQTFPFSYNAEFNDISSASFDIDEEIHVERSGTIATKADAHGTMTLPQGVPVNALRVRTQRTQADTTFVSGLPLFITTVDITSYQWFTEAQKFPVFTISYTTINSNGFITRSKSVVMTLQTGTVDVDQPVATTPAGLILAQNYPNPFNPSTLIRYTLPAASRVTLDVYTMIGQKVAVLVSDEMQSAGDHAAEFTAKNLPSGVYLYRLKAGALVEIRKMTIVK